MAKLIEIHGPAELQHIIVAALELYAQQAFPDSGSPCQMVSREALLEAANKFAAHYQQAGTGIISSRMRAMLKAAIKFYYHLQMEQQNRSTHHQCELLLAMCRGKVTTQQDLLHAREMDNNSDN